MKLEHTVKRGIFQGAKIYGLITNEDEIVIKIKGLNKFATIDLVPLTNLAIWDILVLLLGNGILNNVKGISFTQNKFIKTFKDPSIVTRNISFDQKLVSNKRLLISDNTKLLSLLIGIQIHYIYLLDN